MNMKKTIAAIAAGAVAVSAMATTVSALADTTLVYNLVANVKETWGTPVSTFTFTVNTEATKAETLYAVDAELTAEQYEALSDADKAKVEVETLDADTYICTTEYAADGGNGEVIAVGTEITKADYDALDPAYQVNYKAADGEKTYTVIEEITSVDASNYPTVVDFNAESLGFTVDKITMKVASNQAGEQNKIYTYATDAASFNYNANLTKEGKLTLSNELAGYTGNLALTFTVEATDNWWTGKDGDAEGTKAINNAIAAGTINATADMGNVTPVTYVGNKKTTGNGDAKAYPFMSSINGSADIIDYLNDYKNGLTVAYDGKTLAEGSEARSYHNVDAVLNDAIENYESVTFTFNTATAKIKFDDAGRAYYDGDGDDYWMAFGQHLYTGFYSPENTGWTGFDWTGYNLFQGALVVNEAWTMSLAETDYFDWTATSLTFDWDAIMDGAMTDNSYATYLHSMELVTSTTWYWDNMTVTLTAGAADDVENEAGVEADDEELAEEVVEEEVEEEVVEEEVEEEAEVEVEVANPTTGNASVALAVIPVALAAAAVVAKKRS